MVYKQPIGFYYSSQCVYKDYVACSRATSSKYISNRCMGNINMEPGNSTLEEMIENIENGILLETNNSWSIDDYRNKTFQFGC